MGYIVLYYVVPGYAVSDYAYHYSQRGPIVVSLKLLDTIVQTWYSSRRQQGWYMAKSTTLFDKLNQSSTQPVQQLSANRGLAAPPITAYGTNLIGGTQDQAKMAGTPAQRGAAVAAATKIAALGEETEKEKEETLATAKETVEDISKKELASKYVESLGTYGAKVNEWIDSAKKTLVGTAATVQVDVSDAILTGLSPTEKEQAIGLIKQIATESDNQKRLDLEQQLNIVLKKDINSVLNAEQKGQLYDTVSRSIQEATTAAETAIMGADRKLTVADFTQLGTTVDDLSSLLNVPTTDLANMTIGQLQDKIEQVTQQQLGTAAGIRGAMGSAFSPTERAALRRYLRDVQAVGVAGAEAGVANIVDQVDKGNVVTFAGKQYTVDELLGSPTLTKVFQDAVTEMEGTTKTGPTLEALKRDEPGLYKWVTDNYAGVKALIERSTATSKEFGDIQTTNRAALGEIGKSQPELAKQFGFDPNQLRSTRIDPAQLPPVFQYVNSAPAEQQATLAANLRSLSDVAGADSVRGLDSNQLKQLDLSNPSGLWSTYSNAVKDVNRVANLTTIDDIIKEISSGDESIEQLDSELTGDSLAVALGVPTSNVRELDTNSDGVIDSKDVDGLKERYKGSVPPLTDFLSGVQPQLPTNAFTLSRPRIDNPATSNVFSTIFSLIRDKNIDEGERNTIRNLASPMSESDLASLVNKDWSKVPGGNVIRETMQATLQGKIQERLAKEEAERRRREEEERRRREEEERQRQELAARNPPWWMEKTQAVFEKAGAVSDTASQKWEAATAPVTGIVKSFELGGKAVSNVAEKAKAAAAAAPKKVAATVKNIKKGKIKF